jgi:hypothetical protein
MDSSPERATWDVFISYASEDRDAVAQPLADALIALGLRVWFDQAELRIGDSLRERIDVGLAKSNYGVVILSQAFFAKHYPVRELNGLAQREVAGEKLILPIWHNVTAEQVRAFSPPLADRIAADWSRGIDDVVTRVFAVVGARLLAEAAEASKSIVDLPHITGGLQLIGVLHGAFAHSFVHDEFETTDDANRIGDFLQVLEDWVDGLDEVGAAERAKLSFELTASLKDLEAHGWRVLAHSLPRKWGEAPVARGPCPV